MHDSHITFWPVAEGETLNRWSYSAAQTQYFPGNARPMPDVVDYCFVNGWVATGDLPCREALRNILDEREVQLPAELSFPEIYLGGEDPRVDFSTFCFRPTLVSRWLRCRISTEMAQQLVFSIETCGGLHMWQDEEKVLQLDHYQRNEAVVEQVRLSVPAGETELIVFLEDLHERDTCCYFTMKLIQGQSVRSGIELDLDENQAREIERTLDGLRTDKVYYCEEAVRIVADYLPRQPVKVTLDSSCQSFETLAIDAPRNSTELKNSISFVVDQSFKSAELFDSTSLKAGCISLRFLVDSDKAKFSRTLGTTLLPAAKSMHMSTLPERKQSALQQVLQAGNDEPGRALVALAQNTHLDVARRIMQQTLVPIAERHDCADFRILPMLWAYKKYNGTRLDDSLWCQVKHEVLNFRYWLDEPGNDVMWFWSENHVLCFHVAQYLAGTLFPNEVFPNSGKSGEQHKVQALSRLGHWFDCVDKHGLAEWNSAAYYPIDFLALFTLLVNADDAVLVARAKALIDQIFVMVALHTINSVPAGSQGRVYEKELLAGPATELGSIAAVAFGGDWYPGNDRASVLLALSDYEPPKICQHLLQVPHGKSVYSKYTQGLNHNARVSIWKTSSVQLSTVSDYKTGMKGHQQHFLDVQTSAHPLARFWINHPGDMKVWGGSRPSYWAGNAVHPRVAQYKNMGLMIFDHRAYDDVIDFTHVFVPTMVCDEFSREGNWLFARTGSALIAVFASNDLLEQQHGLYVGCEWRAAGNQTAWLMIVDEISAKQDFSGFKKNCLQCRAQFNAHRNELSVQHEDGLVLLSYTRGLYFDGEPQPFAPMKVIPQITAEDGAMQPWQVFQSEAPLAVRSNP